MVQKNSRTLAVTRPSTRNWLMPASTTMSDEAIVTPSPPTLAFRIWGEGVSTLLSVAPSREATRTPDIRRILELRLDVEQIGGVDSHADRAEHHSRTPANIIAKLPLVERRKDLIIMDIPQRDAGFISHARCGPVKRHREKLRDTPRFR